MDFLVTAFAAVAGFLGGWLAAGVQHRLYQQPEFRNAPMRGRRRLVFRVGLGVAAALIAGLAFRPGHYDAGPALLTAVFGFALAVLSSTDFERRILPNRLTYPAIAAATLLCWAWADRSVGEIWLGAGFALAVGAVLFLLGMLTGGALGSSASPFGLGDVKLIVLIGLLLGWPAVMPALFLGVIAAGVPSLAMLLSGRGRHVFSYGPYLALGALVALLWPERFV